MSNDIADSSTTAVAESGEGMALSQVLPVLAAIVAAEGDIKLVAEMTGLKEVEIRMLWLQHAKHAADFARSYGLLTTVHILGELKGELIQNIERATSTQVKLLELLLGSLGNLAPQPVLQQNNQYNFPDNVEALQRLARRMNVSPDDDAIDPA